MTEHARTPRLRAVLFDFGGTLDGDGLHWSPRFFDAYTRAGFSLDRRRWEAAFTEADRRIAQAGPAEGGLADLLGQQIAVQMDVLGLQDAARERAIRDEVVAAANADLARSRALLASLAPHVRLGVVSNFTGALERVCRDAGLAPFLSVLVDSTVVGVAKPDPEIFRLAVRRIGEDAADCAFVGDSWERDIVPAKSVGLFTIWLRGPSARPCPDPSVADVTLSSLRELPAVLGIRV